jgi:predicted ATPase
MKTMEAKVVERTNRIKVKSITFSAKSFRKLRELEIEFAERLTLIAGHNGIGKSTILGLVANTFGLTSSQDSKSYFSEPFYANIERIVYLALSEVEAAQKNPSAAPLVQAEVNERIVKKRCAMTKRGRWRRARVVPRTVDREEGDDIGPDAKVPLPTIYLGIRRLASFGEADEKDVVSQPATIEQEDARLIRSFISSIMQGTELTEDVSHQQIKGSKKRTMQPGYQQHDSLSVSLGQDSLSSIATALASFNQLKRTMGAEYPGGLLVIDELDAGFHPHAIKLLVDALRSYARRLCLQIIATTHSPHLISWVHPEGSGSLNAPDKVVYLLDTARPRLAPDQSLRGIIEDMTLVETQADEKLSLCVYFEDQEALDFFDALFPPASRGALSRRLGVKIQLIPLGVGGNHLLGLPSRDPIFKDRVLVVDGDTSIRGASANYGNVVKLPCAAGARDKQRSPENSIRLFLLELSRAIEGPYFEALEGLNTRNATTDKVRARFFADGVGRSDEREKTKRWWRQHWATIKQWKVINAWASLHQAEVGVFRQRLELAVTAVATRLMVSRALPKEY